MRKLILTVVLVLAGLTLMAQGRVSTRKYVLNDFSDKITKVVLRETTFLMAPCARRS